MGDIRFRPLDPDECERLRSSLRRNVTDGAALLTARDTSFLSDVPRLPNDDEVIRAIRSVPCHYARTARVSRSPRGRPAARLDGG